MTSTADPGLMGDTAGARRRRPKEPPVKIPTAAEQRQTYLAQIQPHVPEPILAVGFLCTAGYAAGLRKDYGAGKSLGMLSPIAGRMFRKQAVATRVEASRNDLVAVTETEIYRFEFPKRGEAFTVSVPPIVWDRSLISVTAGPRGRYAQPIQVTFADGRTEDFEIANGARDYATFSDDMRALLLGSVSA
ncbi:MAG: hypothetical protein JWO77_1763 [Ilumatobacteraceae bacterium]|nr:hypothetical protein [Ilumatobacteraceae bacterium]